MMHPVSLHFSVPPNNQSPGNHLDDTIASLYLTGFQKKLLQQNLRNEDRREYRQRIQIMLMADQGKTQKSICQELNCAPDTARYWITMAQMGLAHLWHERSIGRPKKVSEEYLNRLKELVSHSPQDYGYGFKRWTAKWLSKHLAKEFQIEISPRHINRLLKGMELSWEADSENSQEKLYTSRGIVITDL